MGMLDSASEIGASERLQEKQILPKWVPFSKGREGRQ